MTSGKHDWIKSHCQLCYNGCAILVEVENGIPVKIAGDSGDPYTRGKLCPRGLSGLTRLYDPFRVKTPLIRTNPKKGTGIDPKWRACTWDEALDRVAEMLRRIRKDNPNKLIYSAFPWEKHVAAGAWGHAFGTVNTGSPFGGLHTKCANPTHVIGMMTNNTITELPDLDYCNYLIMAGTEAGFGTHQCSVQYARKMAEARARGMKLVVVDPRLSVGAAKADEWLPIRPGTDLALFLSMIYLLIHEYKIYDSEFLKHKTNAPYLLDRSGRYVRDSTGRPMVWDLKDRKPKTFDDPSAQDLALEGSYEVAGIECTPAFQFLADHVAQYTPAWASGITSIPEEQIRRITREFAEHAQIGATVTIEDHEYPLRPAALIMYKGSEAHTNGCIAVMAQQIICALLGAVGVPGAILSKRTGRNRVTAEQVLAKVGADGILQPNIKGWSTGKTFGRPFKFPPQRLDLGDYCPLASELGHLVPLVTLDPEKYGFDYAPEALLLFHCNPMRDCGDSNIMSQALKKLDFVVDITTYLDETCDFVDVVLPESSYLERHNLVNFSYELLGMQVAQPATKPLHNTMEGIDILTELAERAGFLHGEGGFNDRLNKALDLRPPFALDLDRKYTWEEILDIQAKSYSNGQRDLDWYKQHGNDFRRCKADDMYLVYRNCRIPIYFSAIKEAGENLEQNLDKYGVREKLGLKLNLGQYAAVPYWEPTPLFSDSEYDLYLISYGSALTSHVEMALNPVIMEIAENDPYLLTVMMNPQTAKSRDIEDGDEVWIESRLAKAKARAKLSQGIHPEVIAVSGGFGRWLDHPVARGKGTVCSDHLPLDLEHSGMIGGSMESAARVKISRVQGEETK